MWGKISDDFSVECLKCHKVYNPYTDFGFMGIPPEYVFNKLPNCPNCKAREWGCYV